MRPYISQLLPNISGSGCSACSRFRSLFVVDWLLPRTSIFLYMPLHNADLLNNWREAVKSNPELKLNPRSPLITKTLFLDSYMILLMWFQCAQKNLFQISFSLNNGKILYDRPIHSMELLLENQLLKITS